MDTPLRLGNPVGIFLSGPGDSQCREPGEMRTGLPKMRNVFI